MTVTVALALADLATGAEVNFTAMYFLGALVTAAHAPARATASVGAAAVALTAFTSTVLGLGGTTVVVRVVLAAAGAGLATFVADQRDRRELRLAAVERVAEGAQRAILAAIPARVGAVAFAARYVSAEADARIGGDLYEVVAIPDRVRVIVGDVCGHGLPSVRLAATTLGAFREGALVTDRLDDLVGLLDQRLSPQLAEEEFVTCVIADFYDDGRLELVNCGHPPPLVARLDGGELAVPPSAATPLGLGPAPEPLAVRLEVGDRVLFYTDGLVEGRTAGGRTLLVERFLPLLRDGTLDEALARVLETVRCELRGSLQDDLALVLAERRPDAARTDGPPAPARMTRTGGPDGPPPPAAATSVAGPPAGAVAAGTEGRMAVSRSPGSEVGERPREVGPSGALEPVTVR